MSTEPSHPPALAVRLLCHLYPKRNRDAITGDLLERFRDGHSNSWFWRRFLSLILVGTFKFIQTALDGNLRCCRRHNLDLVRSVGAYIPDCGYDHIQELGHTIAMACCYRDRDGSDGSAALHHRSSSLENIQLW